MFAYTDTVHRVQSELRELADNLKTSSVGSERNLAKKISDTREKLIDTIDNATNGEYRKGLAKYRTDKQVESAFEKGADIMKNRPSVNEDDPSYWRAWIKNASDDELAAAREGARLAVDRQIRGMRNAAGQKGTEIPQVEFNKQKLGMLFGEKEVAQMETLLNHERKIADTNRKLFEGSQTAMRQKADLRVHERTDEGLSNNILPYVAEGIGAYSTGYPGIGAAAYKAADLGKRYLVNPVKNKLGDATNLELARLASATGPEKDALIQQLSAMVTPPKASMLTKVKSALPIMSP
jgi:hypothetical protein